MTNLKKKWKKNLLMKIQTAKEEVTTGEEEEDVEEAEEVMEVTIPSSTWFNNSSTTWCKMLKQVHLLTLTRTVKNKESKEEKPLSKRDQSLLPKIWSASSTLLTRLSSLTSQSKIRPSGLSTLSRLRRSHLLTLTLKGLRSELFLNTKRRLS